MREAADSEIGVRFVQMAGGGVKGGQTIGTTDDLHATILWLMGLDNMGLVYKYKGRPERPTLNEGEPYKKIAG